MARYIKQLPQENLEFQMFVLDELADKQIEKGHDIIKLTIGISELPVPNKILKTFSDTIYNKTTTRLVYPEGLPILRQGIADYYYKNFNVKCLTDNVFINFGTSAVLRNLFQLLTKPSLEILLPKPYYCLYLLNAILTDATIKYYDIDQHTGQIDLDSFKAVYNPSKTAIVMINNPGNPIGNIIPKEDIIAINNIVQGQSYIIHDEIYNNVLFYEKYESPLTYLTKYKDCHIITNSFSKGFRMYTKRVGYAIVPQQLIMPLRILQQHTVLTCDPVNQMGMVEALKDTESPRELTQIYKARAIYALNTLKDTSIYPIPAKGGFYIVLDCENFIKEKSFIDSKKLAQDILYQCGVATVPGTDFGLDNCLRLSFCHKRFNEAIDRLYAYFQQTETKIHKENHILL